MINGDCISPNTNLLKPFISTRFGSHFFTQWQRETFLSHSRILICKRTFSISPHNKIGLNRDLTKISYIEFWRGEPISWQSFREEEFLFGFEEASYMILSLLVLADSLMTLSLPLLSLVHKLHLSSLQCLP